MEKNESSDAFIKLYRKMLEWEWYDDVNTKIVFIHCLLRANWKPCTWHGIDLQPGEFITSLENLAEETHLTISQVRTALKHLILTGEIASKSQAKCRIITVNNWGCYQGNDKQNRKQMTSKSQADDKQIATDKEYKEYKEREEYKNIKEKYIEKEKLKYFPDNQPLDKTFTEFVAMRKQLKKPMSDKAIELAIKKLKELSGGDTNKAIMILEQSIFHSWQGLFPLKDNFSSASIKPMSLGEQLAAAREREKNKNDS